MKYSSTPITSQVGRSRPNRSRRLALAALAALASPAIAVPLGSSAVAATTAPTTIGHIDAAVASNGQLRLSGWTADTRTPRTPLKMQIFLGGTASSGKAYSVIGTTADKPRQDVGAAYPALGAAHGFDVTASPVNSGTYPVCVYALVPSGFLLGCPVVTVKPDRAPIGHLDSVVASGPGQIVVSGWSLDQDTPTVSDHANIYLGGPVGQAYKAVDVVANRTRNDVAAAFPGAGAAHGYSLTVAAKPGTRLPRGSRQDRTDLRTR